MTAFGLVFALGTSSVIFKALASTWLQLTASPEMRGRVLALLASIGGTTPIGAPVMGWLAEQFAPATFVLAGTLTAIAAVVAYMFMRRTAGTEDPTIHP